MEAAFAAPVIRLEARGLSPALTVRFLGKLIFT
jgi:hypothetical protein